MVPKLHLVKQLLLIIKLMKKILLLLVLLVGIKPNLAKGQQYIYEIIVTFNGSNEASVGVNINYDNSTSEGISFNSLTQSSPFVFVKKTTKKPLSILHSQGSNFFTSGPELCSGNASNNGIVIFDNNNIYSNSISYGICGIGIQVHVKKYLKTGIIISGSNSNIFCGNQILTLTVPDYIENVYNSEVYEWFVSTNGVFPSTTFRTTVARQLNLTIADIKTQYPSYNGETLYFKVQKQGDSFSETSQSVIFSPAIPIPQTKTPNTPLCANGLGSISLSNFKYDDGTVYNGGENLSITLTNQASGIPEAPIVFTGTSITIPNLAPGNYTAQINNSSATCTNNFSFTIPPAPPPITALATAQNPDCASGTGSITATGGGGTSPYQYSIDGGTTYQTSNVFTNLAAGSYSVTITDANNCTAATSNLVTIVLPTAVNTVLSNKTNPTGFGLSNGQIIVSANGGSGTAYSYSIDGVNYSSSDTFSGLAAGTYNLTAKDSKGCTSVPLVVLLVEPSVLNLAITAQTDNICFGGNNGSIDVSANGGASPYTYSINGGSYQIANSFGNLTSGNYSLSVKDSNGNTANVTASILQPNVISVSVIGQNPNCATDGGTITANATGGTAPYKYALNGGTYQASNVFTDLIAGTYTVTVSDANNCSASTSNTVTISLPNPVNLSLSFKYDPTGFSSNDGQIAIVAGGGSGAGFTYSIDGVNYVTSATFTALAAGTYSLRAKDGNGCLSNLLNVTLNQPNQFSINVTGKIDNTCFGGNTGSVTVTANGGTAPYKYEINGSGYQSSNNFTGLTAGNYTINAKDANDYEVSTTVTITQPQPLTANIVAQNPNCNTGNGTITATAAGGVAPYQYALNGGAYQTSNVFSGLTNGSYTVTVIDANNCAPKTSNAVSIVIPEIVNAVVSFQNNPSAVGANDGQIVVAASGGSNAGYSFSINGSAYNPSGTFAGLAAGTYLITAKDANGCISNSLSVTINAVTQLSLNVSSKVDNSCNGGSTGSIVVAGNGGVPPFQYRINGGNFEGSGTFNGLVAGSYTLTVKDASNSTASAVVNIAQPAAITANIIKTDAACFNGNGNIIISNTTGGSGSGYSYSSNGGANYQTNNVFNLQAGTYIIKIKDGNGCISADNSITIAQPMSPLQATVVTQDVKCNGLSSGVVTLSATGGAGGYIYSKDNWISSNTTGIFSGLLAGQYEFKIKDQTNCTISLSVLVKQPPELVLNIESKTDANCFGGTGTINVSATGGEGNIAYSSNPSLPFNNGVFSGATAGTYEIKIIDGNGCIKFNTVTINQPSQLIAFAAVTNVNCYNAADGKVVLSGTGGTGAYTYAIKNFGTFTSANTFTGLSAGNYIFSIKDQNGCVTDISADIFQPDELLINISNKQNVLCNGNANGSFTVTASGGTGNFNYKLNGVDNGSNNSFTNLSPGNYIVRVTDTNGCFKEISEIITEPSSLNLSLVNKKDIKCFGSNNGEISVVAVGGVAPYQYALNGAIFQSSPSFTGLIAGNHTIQVMDANQCLQSINVTILEPQKLIAVIVKDDVKCFGEASGIITMNVSGGEGPYLYSINGSNFQLNNTFSNLVAGNYNLTVQDKNNCQLTQLVSIINIAPKLTLELLATSPTTCDALGSIKVNAVNGGTAPYLYSIDGNNYGTSQVFDSLAAGLYTVFVKDSKGCITSESKTISVPSGISAQALITNVSCFSANNGNILIRNVNGGNGNYLYAINGGSFQTSNNFSNLTAGNYTIIVKDSPYSCQYTLNESIGQPSKLNLELKSKSDISCYGQSNGRIEVSANGGIAPFQYSIDGGVTYSPSGVFSALIAKNYDVQVKDANNCTDHISVLLTVPSLLTVSISNKTDVTCFGLKNGSIVLNAAGGTQPYQYSINNGTQQTSNRFDNLTGGDYLVTLTDANGCTAIINVVVNENPILSLSVSSFKNLSCNANASGEISVIASGGSGVYQYAINNGLYQSFPIFKNLSAGSYIISVKDDKGCVSTITKSIAEPAVLTVSKTVKQQKCFDICDGEIKLSVSGGTAPYTYNWSSGNFGNVSTISNLCGGTYKVTVVDANGCSVEDVTDIITPQEIKITNVSDTVLCVDQIVTYDAGNPGFTYLWTADNGFSETTQKVQISKSGKYQLKVTNTIGCSVLKIFTVQTSTTLLKANFLVSTYGNVGDTIIVVDVSKPTPAKTSWIFDSGTTLVGSNATGTIKQISFNNPGVYNMMMMVNLGQCADAVQKSITILPKEQKAQVNNALGYKEQLFKEVKVYPNPTNGEFKAIVKLSEKMEIKSSLYGFSGNLILAPIKSSINDNFEINFSQTQLTPGIYLLTIEAGSQVKTLKIIKL